MTLSWECIRIPSVMTYSEGLGRVLGAFLREFFASGAPEEMAIFKVRRAESNAMIVYLTPLAAKHLRAVLTDFSLEPCAPPSRALVAMVAGHMAARDLLPGDD